MICPYEKCPYHKRGKQFTKEELGLHLKKSHKQKIKQSTEQYGKTEDIPSYHKMLILAERNGLKYPACEEHGALIAHDNHIYRCIPCGWAVRL